MRKNRKRIRKISLIITIIIILLIFIFTSKETIANIGTQSETSNISEINAEESTTYYYVESSDGVQVPVPVGYTASEIEGETGVSTGFVIYEGDIDWSEIIVDETDASSASLDASDESADYEIATTSLDNTNSISNTDKENNNTENINTNSIASEATEESNNTSSNISEDNEENSNVAEASNSGIENSLDTNSVEESSDVEKTNAVDTSDETVVEEETLDSETSNSENEIESNIISNYEIDDIENETVSESEEEAIDGTEEIDDITYSLDGEDEEIATINESDLAVVDTEDYYLSAYYSEETASNIWDLQAGTNQYVWVPIDAEELEKIYGVDSNGKYWGKLYTAYSTAAGWTETNGLINITSVYSKKEPDVLAELNSNDSDAELSSNLNGTTKYELLTQELEESFYETIESIRKYGGFYIGRYETGNLSSFTAVVQKANTFTSSVTWYVMYEKCKGLAGENSNVTTSMIWGSLWDATLRWLYESEATDLSGTTLTKGLIWRDSTTWGNYENSEFDYYTSYDSISTKSSSTSTIIGTGMAEYTKVNNIYDIAGNNAEWDMESSYNVRVARGGWYGDTDRR